MGYDFPVICDKGASCHMSHSSSAGTLNYRYANITIRTASGKIYPIEGCGGHPLTSHLAVVRYLCGSAVLNTYQASSIICFL